MSSFTLKRQLKSLRTGIVPRVAWTEQTRSQLLAQIGNTLPRTAPSFWRQLQSGFSFGSLVMRPVAVLVMFALTASGWVATSRAAFDTVPGDTLYPVKRATEKTQMAWVEMINDKTKAVEFHLELAKRRAQEAEKIIVAQPQKKPKIAQTVTNIKQELVAANSKLEDIKKQTTSELSSATVTALQKQTDDIKKTLQAVKAGTDGSLSKEVAEVKSLIKDTDLATVEVAVAGHLKGSQELSKEYVSSLIGKTLQEAVAEVAGTKTAVDEAKNAVENVVKGLSDNTLIIVSSSTSSTVVEMPLAAVASSTSSTLLSGTASTTAPNSVTTTLLVVKEVLNTAATDTAQFSVKTAAAAEVVDQKTEEVKILLSRGELSEAVNKIKEVATAAKEVEKISDTARLQLQQTVLPAVDRLQSRSDASISVSSSVTSSAVAVIKEKIDALTKPVVTPSSTPTSTTVSTGTPLMGGGLTAPLEALFSTSTISSSTVVTTSPSSTSVSNSSSSR